MQFFVNIEGDQERMCGKLTNIYENVTVACTYHFRLLAAPFLLPSSSNMCYFLAFGCGDFLVMILFCFVYTLGEIHSVPDCPTCFFFKLYIGTLQYNYSTVLHLGISFHVKDIL